MVGMTGCIVCALSLTAASFADNLLLLYVSYSVFGTGAAGVFLAGFHIVQKSFDKRRSIALGIISAGLGLGTMVLSQVLQVLVSVLNWRNSLRIMAGALVVNGLLGLLYNLKRDISDTSVSEPLACEEPQRIATTKHFSFNLSVWKVPGFLNLTACYIVVMFGRSIVYVHLVKYSEDCGVPSDKAARLILYLGIQTVLGRFACGFLCSYKRLHNSYIYQGVLLIIGVSTLLVTLAKSYGAFVAYALVFGFTDGAWATVNNIQAVSCVDESRAASAFGFMLLAGSLTSMVGPPISGLAADKFGSYDPAFYMAGGALLTASLIQCVFFYLKFGKETGAKHTATEHICDLQVQSNLNDVQINAHTLEAVHQSNEESRSSSDHFLFISTV